MSAVPPKRIYYEGKYRPVRYGVYKSFGYGDCCCADCCQEFVGGEFDEEGKLVFESEIVKAVFTMPTPGSRGYCGGDTITIDAELLPPYDELQEGESEFLFHLWLDRDWHHLSHAAILGGNDQAAGANWFVWHSSTSTTQIQIRFIPCWIHSLDPVGYSQQYGEIQVGTRVGDADNENVLVLSEELPTVEDCCPYPMECAPCRWVFPPISDPIGPEVTEEGWTYWVEDNGWAKRTIVSGIDTDSKTMTRGDTINFDSQIRPRKDSYLYYEDLEIDMGLKGGDGWRDLEGTQEHPQSSPPDLVASTALCPSARVDATEPCHPVTRVPSISDALIFALSAKMIECSDEECDAEADPVPLETKACVTDGNSSATLDLEYEMEACPNPEEIDCCDCNLGWCLGVELSESGQPDEPEFDCPPSPGELGVEGTAHCWYHGHSVDDGPPAGNNYHTHFWVISYCGTEPGAYAYLAALGNWVVSAAQNWASNASVSNVVEFGDCETQMSLIQSTIEEKLPDGDGFTRSVIFEHDPIDDCCPGDQA